MSRPGHLPSVISAATALALALPTPAAGADNGIKIGDGRLHPYLAIEGRYDSNVLFGTNASRTPDFILHLKPGFDLQIPGNQLSLDFGANIDWNKYLGVSSDQTKDLTHLFAEATLALAAYRLGTVGLELDDAFRRSDQTRSYSIATAVVSNYNDLKVAVPFRPGGGALALTVGGEWLLESFEPFLSGANCDVTTTQNGSCDTASLSKYGYSQVAGRAEVRWKFLPKTALAVEGSYFARLPNDTSVSTAVKGLKTLAGLAGLVTPHLAATLKAGYGDTLGSAAQPFRTWLANVEIEYATVGPAGGRVGWVHEYSADPVRSTALDLSVYGIHRVYLEGRLLFGGRLTASARGEYDAVSYAFAPVTLQVAQFSPKLDMEVTRWLYLGTGYALSWRSSSGSGATAAPVPGYTKHEVWLSAKFVY